MTGRQSEIQRENVKGMLQIRILESQQTIKFYIEKYIILKSKFS